MPNALAHEKSPYLLQHVDNPVAWLPWGEAAFARARAEGKPIFLSIGYSTCHWCHVMAHESFENEATARLLNEHFIPVKVDREERPDVDKVYMAYVQAMTGHGGWPLSAWLTPELKPFYGGTYYPPADQHGRPGFPTILEAIARGWSRERDKLEAEAERAMANLLSYHGGSGAGDPAEDGAAVPAEAVESRLLAAGSEAMEKGFKYFHEAFDARHGGFGGAPKFPRAANLNLLFRIAALQGLRSELGTEAIRLATSTLRAMARGGIHDHLGGGYHRYSVDAGWFVPHFEKMLYDQAQIAVNCLEARQATGDERFAWMARDILAYVARDLTGPEGGFHTAEDADSPVAAGRPEHAEGAFYVWTAEELREVLGPDAAWFAAHFGVQPEGNVPGQLDPQGELRGRNILVQRRSLAETASELGLTPEAANDRLLGALERLRTRRAARPRPLLDDKVITANNGLMISALARAHQVLGSSPEEDFLARAVRAADFVARELHDPARGVLYRSWRQGRGAAAGFAEDYAFLIQGLLDLYEASFAARWLEWADGLQATMDRLFWDEARGGYFNSAADDPHLVLRLREDYDGAEPAPSSVAAMNLLRLAAMTNDPARRARGRRTLEAFQERWESAPQALPQLLCALELALEPPRHVVLAGDPAAEDFRALAAVLHEELGPRRILLAADGGSGQAWLARRASWLAELKPADGGATAYVCEEFTCQAPAISPEELRRVLRPAGSSA
jgi:uncharacterized protein YyaL (SSP411 family)